MEVDVSMIIGYVMKFNYVLPYNASYVTDPYVRYDRSINRHVQPDENDASPPDAKGIMFFVYIGCESLTAIERYRRYFFILEILNSIDDKFFYRSQRYTIECINIS